MGYRKDQEAWVEQVGLKVGDTVLVTCAAPDWKSTRGSWFWRDEKNRMVGHQVPVHAIYEEAVLVNWIRGVSKITYALPFFILIKVEEDKLDGTEGS